jgi:hypothetical protein
MATLKIPLSEFHILQNIYIFLADKRFKLVEAEDHDSDKDNNALRSE